MKTLLILNDPPYGSERDYNALRLAHALMQAEPEGTVTIFLMADAIVSARKGQKTPDGYCNMERMLNRVITGRGRVLICGTCMDARGMTDEDIIDGAARSTMPELPEGTISADKVLVF